MNKEQQKQMDEYYQELVNKGTITDINSALAFKLGYEKALNLPVVGVTLCDCDDRDVKYLIKNWCEDCEKYIV